MVNSSSVDSNITGGSVSNTNLTQSSTVTSTVTTGGIGPSAYQLAVSEGYIGTLTEWIASLVGPTGADSTVPGPTGDTGATGATGSTGGGLANVVEDLTPQLGGELDALGNNIIDLADVTFKTGAIGGTVRTGTSAADKFVLQAYKTGAGAGYQKVLEVDAGTSPTLEVFSDSFRIWDSTDETKQLQVNMGSVATGTTRTLTMANADVNLADIATKVSKSGAESIAGIKTFTDDLKVGNLTLQSVAGGGKLLGSSGGAFNVTDQVYTSSIATTGTISATSTVTGSNLSGTNTGDQDLSSLVVGPASATDNAIARFDATTGKLIQNSNVTVSDAGSITTAAGDITATSGNVTGYYLHTDASGGVGTNLIFEKTAASGVTIDGVLIKDGGLNGVPFVTTTDTQTLTNKTLTAPVLSSTVTGTYTIGGTPTFPSAVAQLTTTQTLTNKRITKRVTTATSTATPTPAGDTTDVYYLSTLTVTATFAAPTGTPTDGQQLTIRVKSVAAQTLAWNAIYLASGVAALPTTSVAGKTITAGFVYDSAQVKWVLMAVDAVGY